MKKSLDYGTGICYTIVWKQEDSLRLGCGTGKVLLLHRGCGFKAAESGIWIQVRPKKCEKI